MHFWRKYQLLWLAYRRMLIVYMLIVLLPAGGLLYYYMVTSSHIVEKQVTQSILKSVQQVKINVDYRLSKVAEISDALILNKELYELLSNDPKSGVNYDQVEEEEKLESMIRNLQGNDIAKIKLYVNPDKMYAREHVNFFSLREATQLAWYDEIIRQNGSIYWAPSHEERYSGVNGEVRVISAARIIRDPKEFSRIIGILVLDVPEANLLSILRQAELDESSRSMYIVNQAEYVVSYEQRESALTLPQASELHTSMEERATGIVSRKLNSEPYYVIYDSLSEGGWKIASLLPARQINHRSADFNFGFSIVLTLSLALLFIVSAFLVFAHVTRGTIGRVRHITEQLRERGASMIEEGIPHRSGVVIQLEKSVSHMLATFQRLMDDNYRAKEREKEARLRALQAQINPHFLYNALDTINWMALTKGAHDISKMLNMLAQYFRLTLNKGNDIVALEDEMNLTRAFLEIQKQRFHNFDYSVEVAESLFGRQLPKLTVQPIIENAIMHGIHNKEEHYGHLRVVAYEEEGTLVIQVTDDGTGMEKAQVDAIMASLHASSSPSSYGLYNVWERVRLFTEGAGSLEIESEPGAGTTVSIRMPGVTGAEE
ncbi:sensor histidine kinase [Paenibacillus sp. HB172176]|uniref:cache domain-containing sensor histidine kinase n=1 Tax=Paenibacillus sp. HB172176 TaxID=2493690 RepID=UPI00143C854E|nr:sensor histidine kinase [Paenibacillus sp. HB172176]